MLPQLCHVCSSPAVRTCQFCGRPACETHYEEGKGACTSCARGVRA